MQTLLLLALLLQPSPALPAALEAAASDVSPRKLLTDRSWFSQVARVQPAARRPADDVLACVAVSDPLHPGLTVEGYELVERSGLLGVCKHQQAASSSPQHQPQQQSKAQTVEMELVPWVTDGFSEPPHTPPVCPHPAAIRSAAAPQHPPLPPPLPAEPLSPTDEESNPEGPVLEYQYMVEDAQRIYVNAHYRLKKKFDAGSHGEVWRATRRHGNGGDDEHFVLKRLFLELGESMAQMGLREAHFGARLQGERHVTRFVEYFFRPAAVVEGDEDEAKPRVPTTPELWLVFYDEGQSLRHYLYEKHEVVYGSDGGGAGVVLQPSRFWEKLRTDARGESVLREIMRQLLQGVAALHARGITHRDIKPSNILLAIPAVASSSPASAAPPTPLVKLADFGSAVDDYTLHHLYDGADGAGASGPTQAEETREYQPPEVLFSDNGQPYDYTAPEAYDLWSVGVVFLEMVLGSPQVFLLSSRARAKLDATLDAQQRRHRSQTKTDNDESDDGSRAKAYLLHVLTQEFCIFHPAPRQLRSLWDKYALVSESCHFGRFNQTIVERDPLRRGLEDAWGLDLMWRLLQWHPTQRISAEQALQHAFFHGAYVCQESGRRFATRQELRLHERYLEAQRARESVFASVVRAKYELPDRFLCPHCGRVFATAQSCEQHTHARRHDELSGFCAFEARHITTAIRTESQPLYVPTQSPKQPAVGVALFQGRKKYMEDFVLVLSEQQLQQKLQESEQRDAANVPALDFELYAVVDGHLGSAAATFVVDNLAQVLARHFAAIPNATEVTAQMKVNGSEEAVSVRSAERELAERFALRQTFLELHEGVLRALDVATNGHDPLSNEHDEALANGKTAAASLAATADAGEYFSGCTLTVALYFRRERRLVSANVGDSRALAWLPSAADHSEDGKEREDGEAAVVLPLSMDHWPNDPEERARIESSGGFVSFAGLWRVVGQLAVSRSLGDRHLRQYVTAEPSVFHATLDKQRGSGGFLVVASDGLWEAMSNTDVSRFLSEKQAAAAAADEGEAELALNDVATELLTEGYVRGSLDNLAVLLVALS